MWVQEEEEYEDLKGYTIFASFPAQIQMIKLMLIQIWIVTQNCQLV